MTTARPRPEVVYFSKFEVAYFSKFIDNIGYPRQRTVTPPGNSSSSDQPEDPDFVSE